MPKIKRRIDSGSVCEQEVFTVPANKRNLKTAEPRPRFKTEDERERHKIGISRRHHTRLMNTNFTPKSFYSTLTLDVEHEAHTYEEARQIRDLYVRRIRHANPDAKIMIYIGKGRKSNRFHFHMVSDGLSEKVIRDKWHQAGKVYIEHLRAHNYYNGVDHGQDYTGLANYLFNHWTPEQGGHRWKATKNMQKPTKEERSPVKRNYSPSNPPKAPKGYRLVECRSNQYGYLNFKYVRDNNNKPVQMKC